MERERDGELEIERFRVLCIERLKVWEITDTCFM